MPGGFNSKIADRLDLTLECVRRHFVDDESPLSSTLERYPDFFALFGDFKGYVDFFLLNDLVSSEYQVRFSLPFYDFQTPALPGDREAYLRYRRRSIEFIEARNRRIQHRYSYELGSEV